MRWLLALPLLGVLDGPGLAADGAQSRAIGFSPDGKYFAFEQYGVQDGSGFEYADIFVIDLAADTWVKGTPVKVMDKEEGEDEVQLDATRAKALAQAKPVLDKLNITGSVETLVHMPFTQLGIADRRTARFGRYYASSSNPADYDALGAYDITVQDVKLPAPGNCFDLDIATPVGMEVTVRNLKSGKAATAAKDTAIPTSRSCPHAYDIEAVFASMRYTQGPDPLVALVGVYSRGFEGSDRRFVAVPFTLPE